MLHFVVNSIEHGHQRNHCTQWYESLNGSYYDLHYSHSTSESSSQSLRCLDTSSKVNVCGISPSETTIPSQNSHISMQL